MTIFDKYRDATRRLQAAEADLRQAKNAITPFTREVEKELMGAYRALKFDGMEPPSRYERCFVTEQGNFCPSIMVFGSEGHRGLPADDAPAQVLAESIVQAAAKHGIVVEYDPERGQGVRVPHHVMGTHPEQAPEILLRALAAYGKDHGKAVLGSMIEGTANAMKEKVTQLSEGASRG